MQQLGSVGSSADVRLERVEIQTAFGRFLMEDLTKMILGWWATIFAMTFGAMAAAIFVGSGLRALVMWIMRKKRT